MEPVSRRDSESGVGVTVDLSAIKTFANLLGGTVTHRTGCTSGGRTFNRIVIEYDVREIQEIEEEKNPYNSK